MEKTYFIYMHTAPNGKAYIGQTCDLQKRSRGHQTKTGCRAFYSAIKKYGWNNFSHQILASGLSLELANLVESEAISLYRTMSPNGYNLRSGGDNSLHSDETKELQRVAKLGKKHSKESLERISIASKNQSAETREKQRLARLGSKRSPETIARMSDAAKARWQRQLQNGPMKQSQEWVEKRAASLREVWRLKKIANEKEAAQGDLFAETTSD